MIFVLLKTQYVLLLEVEKRYYKIIYILIIYNVITQAIIIIIIYEEI